MKQDSRKKILKLMLVLTVIGALFAGYQTYEHYFLQGSSICDFGEGVSCSAVTGSQYGEFPQFSGIAVSLYGLFWFIALAWLLRGSIKGKEKFKLQDFYTFLLTGSGILGVLYFLWVELIALPALTGELIICPFCTVQHVIIPILFVLSFITMKKSVKYYLKELFIED